MELLNGLAALSWREPLWLVLLGWPILWWLYRVWREQRLQATFAERALWPWVKSDDKSGKLWRWSWLAVCWFAVVVALAGPRWVEQVPQNEARESLRAWVLLDASLSMSAQDVVPSRFEFSKRFLESLLSRLDLQDRIGLIAYAGQAHQVTPLTKDPALRIRGLSLLQLDQLPLAGSAHLTAWHYALERAIASKPASLIWFTDGVDFSITAEMVQIAQGLQAESIPLLIVGVGKQQKVGLVDIKHPTGWLHDNNEPVNVALAAEPLRAFAELAGGDYFQPNADLASLQAVIDALLATTASQPVEKLQTHYIDLAYGFIFLAWLAAWIGMRFQWVFGKNE